VIELIEKVKLYLAIADTSKDELLAALTEDAMAFATDFCGIDAYDAKLNSTVCKMVLQDYTKLTGQVITDQPLGGSAINGYSEDVMGFLRKFRTVKFF
jgi:hypothetical protein